MEVVLELQQLFDDDGDPHFRVQDVLLDVLGDIDGVRPLQLDDVPVRVAHVLVPRVDEGRHLRRDVERVDVPHGTHDKLHEPFGLLVGLVQAHPAHFVAPVRVWGLLLQFVVAAPRLALALHLFVRSLFPTARAAVHLVSGCNRDGPILSEKALFFVFVVFLFFVIVREKAPVALFVFRVFLVLDGLEETLEEDMQRLFVP